MEQAAFKSMIDSAGVCRLIFDLPGEKVNTFSPAVLEELEKHIEALANNKEIKILLILSGKKNSFVAGANLKHFVPAFKDPSLVDSFLRKGHQVFRKIELLPFPSVAVIDGICVGGGLEFALACTYRVVTDHSKTLLGLPEVNLGIFPGWGGTQRLPRLIGLVDSLPLILSGRTIPALKAWKMHIADAIYPQEFLDEKLNEFIKFALSKDGAKKIVDKRKQRSWISKLLENNPIGRAILFKKAEKDLLEKTKGHYPAPVAALHLIKRTCTLPLQEGLDCEVAAFVDNVNKAFVLSKYLIPIFFTQEALKKNGGWEKYDEKMVREVTNSAVLGAGTMGAGLAWLISNQNIPVRLKDINWEVLGKGLSHIHKLYEKPVKEKKIKKEEASLKLHKVSTTVDYSGFHNVDFIIEAVIENLELKRKIFDEIESIVSTHTVIASNTSSLTVADMSAGAKVPERFVGMHFFNPPNKMPLVEVVRGPKTSDATLATTISFCKKLGKVPLVVGDCHGFLVNRIFAVCANEIMWLFEEGVPLAKIEKVLLDFGMPMSPFHLADEVGTDVMYKVTKIFESSYGQRMKGPEIMQKIYDAKLFGKKSGKGFYLYKDDKATKVNSEILSFVNKRSDLDESTILDRTIFTMINEAARCLEEKIVSQANYLDLALIMGIGFPPYRGGLLRYADELGVDNVTKRLEEFEKLYGARFEPCELLRTMTAQHRLFYED